MTTLLDLKPAHQYTIVRYGEMGFIFSIQLILISVTNEPYAQYRESIVVRFRKKRARSPGELRFLPHDDYLVYDGWVEPKTDMYVTSSRSPSGMVTQQSLLSFDREYMEIAKRSVPKSPILEKIRAMPNADTATILGRKEAL